MHIGKSPDAFKVTIFTSTFGWSRYWCEVDGAGRVDGAGMIVDALGVNEKPQHLRLTRASGGLKIEARGDGDGFFCPRGGELDKETYFIPVQPGAQMNSSADSN